MGSVHVSEAKQGTLQHPFVQLSFLDPVACDSEVAVGIRSLPCIASEVNFAANTLALAETSTYVSPHNKIEKEYDLR
jgi:hypothetical protein